MVLFTITRIDSRTSAVPAARGEGEYVAIHFSERVKLEDLRRNLKFIPPVPLLWLSSTVTDKNILQLAGRFKPVQRYVLVLPPAFKSANGKTFAKGVTAFTMADRDPQIAFHEQGSVIERNSRQMLHVQLMNVNEVQINTLQVPPVIVPLRLSEEPWAVAQAEIMRTVMRLKDALQGDADFRPLVGDAFAEQQLFFSRGAHPRHVLQSRLEDAGSEVLRDVRRSRQQRSALRAADRRAEPGRQTPEAAGRVAGALAGTCGEHVREPLLRPDDDVRRAVGSGSG